jgi:hypothetical protein
MADCAQPGGEDRFLRQMRFQVLLLPLFLSTMTQTLSAAPAVPPRLFFSADEAPALLERATSGEHRMVWEDVQRRAHSYADRQHKYFRDPENVSVVVEGVADERMRMLNAGRHLAVWAESLGPVGELTGRDDLLEHGARLTVALAGEWPFDAERAARVDILAHGEMMRGLAVAYDFFNARMSPQERRMVADISAGYIRDFLAQARAGGAWWYPNSNHLSVAGGAAGLLALAIEDAYPMEAPQWADRCRELIEIWMSSSFDEEGAYSEGASYIEYANVNVALFAHALVRRGGPELNHHPHIRNAPRFLAMSLLPGTFETEARNSAGFSAHFASPWMKRLAAVNGDGLAAWLWQHRQGRSDYPMVQLDHSDSRGLSFFRILWHFEVEPTSAAEILPLNLHFPGRGLCIWRTGWEQEDVMFTIEAGQYYNVTHNQSDEGHFNLYGHGFRWATDPGAGNQFHDEDRSQGLAHSLVLVDGKAQAKSGSGRGTDGAILQYEENERYSYALADATEAYNRNVAAEERERVPGKGPDHLAAGVRFAHRHALFIRPSGSALPYALLIDDIEKDDEVREYVWQLVTEEEMTPEFKGHLAVIRPSGAEPLPRLHLFVAALGDTSWSSALRGFPDNRQPARVRLIHAATRAQNPLFISVLVPVPAGGKPPVVEFGLEESSVTLTWQDRVDRIEWRGHQQAPGVAFEHP